MVLMFVCSETVIVISSPVLLSDSASLWSRLLTEPKRLRLSEKRPSLYSNRGLISALRITPPDNNTGQVSRVGEGTGKLGNSRSCNVFMMCTFSFVYYSNTKYELWGSHSNVFFARSRHIYYTFKYISGDVHKCFGVL